MEVADFSPLPRHAVLTSEDLNTVCILMLMVAVNSPLKDMKYYNSFRDKPILRGTSSLLTANLFI
jgi:hypothetical protein